MMDYFLRTNNMKKTSISLMIVALLACMGAQALASNYYGHTGQLNPFNPAASAVETVIDRTLVKGFGIPHAGEGSGFTDWTTFADYSFGKSDDKRAGGFDNYFNSYTFGADAFYGTTLWGLMGNFNESQGRSAGGAHSDVDSWTWTLYMSRPLNEWSYWGASLSYGTSENDIRGVNGTTDADNYVFAPYVTMLKRMDKLTLSLSPSYVLGYQDVDNTGAANDDTSWMGKLLVMGRATYAVTEKLDISANLNFNQVVHYSGLRTDVDNDHNWFTTGVKAAYKFNDSLSGSLGYTTEFDSDYNSDIYSVGLVYAF
jgi:hypothetical protein